MQLHDILQLRTSVILPEAISDGGLAPTTDTSLFLTTYRGGSHLPSDIPNSIPFPMQRNFLSGLTSYIAIVYLTIQKSKIYMYCLYNSRMLRHSCCEVRVMQLHDILQLRTSVILPEAISDGGLALTTDTSLFFTIYRGGGISHLIYPAF